MIGPQWCWFFPQAHVLPSPVAPESLYPFAQWILAVPWFHFHTCSKCFWRILLVIREHWRGFLFISFFGYLIFLCLDLDSYRPGFPAFILDFGFSWLTSQACFKRIRCSHDFGWRCWALQLIMSAQYWPWSALRGIIWGCCFPILIIDSVPWVIRTHFRGWSCTRSDCSYSSTRI